ncbi:MAG: hypothetical protein F6K24_47085 [Okeania sp. SIO2D1]|nr:hypothetical protein [Okeania sp. SIO2D1]
MSKSTNWYIVKQSDGMCHIVAVEDEQIPQKDNSWGPFTSQAEAIARRVGLIRAGKCQPQ